MKMEKVMKNLLLSLFCLTILLLSLRGNAGNPTPFELLSERWTDDGPFELSPERGKFALAYSIAEEGSLFYSLNLARFVTPDLGYYNGNYVSLFAPGTSIFVLPGYVLGKIFGLTQVGTFLVIAVFATLNCILLRAISIKLGAKERHATIASLIFLFATPAFSYAVTLYQHHLTVFILLASFYLILGEKSILNLVGVWFLLALSLLIDYPNLILLFPIGLYALTLIFSSSEIGQKIFLKIKLNRLITFLGAILPMAFFFWFNWVSYGSPLRLSGTVDRVVEIDKDGSDALLESEIYLGDSSKPTALGYFNTRNMLNGLSVLTMSPDRGFIVFAPVLLFSVFGISKVLKDKDRNLNSLFAVMLLNITIYSMWGDPWGGWAFGGRYLIPSYAIFSIFLALGFSKIEKAKILKTIFLVLLVYSVSVNSLGAITTSKNPPKVEARALSSTSGRSEKYTYIRNLDYLLENGSKSFIYREYLSSHIAAPLFYLLITSAILIFFGCLLYETKFLFAKKILRLFYGSRGSIDAALEGNGLMSKIRLTLLIKKT